MKKIVLIFTLGISICSRAQTVSGAWYGTGNVRTSGSTSNYMVELILQSKKNNVTGVLNYYFKNYYRSMEVNGNYDPASRQLILKNVPVSYYGSLFNLDVDCIMNMFATLRVARAGSNLQGRFMSLPEQRYTCPDVFFNLKLDNDYSHPDSVKKAIGEFREIYQVWKPTPDDSLAAVITKPPEKAKSATEEEFVKRKNEITHIIEVESDSLKISVYDNGQIDGDIISLFFNNNLILNYQKLTHKAIRLNLVLDAEKSNNEISMFAENLGLIPPNTALMVITDGKNTYEISVASSLEKNATISIRRKNKTLN